VRISRRELEARNRRQARRIDGLIAERDDALEGQTACASQLERAMGELSRAKDVIALHMVAAGHPSTVVHDVRTFAEALREALSANRVDLTLELARLEGRAL
jgi:hypothetical protein